MADSAAGRIRVQLVDPSAFTPPYDRALAASLESSLEKYFAQAERVTLAKLHERPFLVKLRDGLARLWMHYL